MWSSAMLQCFITGETWAVAVFSHLRCQGDKWKAESPAQLIKWVSDNKSIFSHCVDKQYICTVTAFKRLEAQAMLDWQHYKGNVPIIRLAAAVKASADEDTVSKGNLYQVWAKLLTQQTLSRLILQTSTLGCAMATSQERQKCNWTLICAGLWINNSS